MVGVFRVLGPGFSETDQGDFWTLPRPVPFSAFFGEMPPPLFRGRAMRTHPRKDHYKRLIKRSFTWDDHEENHTKDSFRMGKVSHGHFGALN